MTMEVSIQRGDYLLVDRPNHPELGPFCAIALLPPTSLGLVFAINEFGNTTNVKVDRIIEHWPDSAASAGKKAYDRFVQMNRGVK